MRGRPFDKERDLDAVARIWRETGWIEPGDDDRAAFDVFAAGYRGLVAELNGEAECYVATGDGSLRYQDHDLPLSIVAAVTTSHVARRQGLAGELTAASVARDADAGAAVSALGMFEQGFYNRLGFGTGSYEIRRSFDPAFLRVPVIARPPIRLTADDAERVHASRLARHRGHGACTIEAPSSTQAEMMWGSSGFGLGYADGPNGEITHHFWVASKTMEHGPWAIWWIAYQTPEQFLELMALLGSFGDQVHLVRMREPAGIQLQDLLHQPFSRHRISEKSQFEASAQASAYWQIRICDVAACIGAVQFDGPPLRFTLELTDPITGLLTGETGWRGVGGTYTVELGAESHATPGGDSDLPVIRASVGAFSRMWLGVLPATGLAITDDLDGPAELLAALDRVFRFPPPSPDWDF